MTAVVVDTNVPIVANAASTNASLICMAACVQILREITTGAAGMLVIDDEFRIINEYKRHLTPFTGQLPGDVFFTWLFNNQYDPAICERVAITEQSNDPNDFAEFPTDPALAHFDPSDRKFVAVSLASQHQPEILNAVDSDWWLLREPLQQNGINLRFLCPDAMPK